MASLAPLQQLRRLDKSSPQFPVQLAGLLHGQGYRSCVANLQDEDVLWLVEYLDNVLGTLHPTSPAFRKCLRELRVACGCHTILPQAYMLPDSPLSTTKWPIASRGTCDEYEGLLNGSKVSIKRLRIYSREEHNAKRAFYQEAVVWKHLTHPNIIPLLGVTVTPFQLVSIWMPGGELTEYIDVHPRADRVGLVSDVANGLSHLHFHGVIHGDLKGPSILVDDTGHARLTDFGLAAITSDSGSAGSITESHAVRWAAPEILDRKQPVNKESDVYSFSMVVIEVFTGKAPFYSSTVTTVAVDVLSGNRPERPTHPSLTDDLWDLTKHCWDHDPRRRPEMSEVVLRLRTTSTPRRDDSPTPDDATLVGVRQTEPLPRPRYQPSRSRPASCKSQRLWKLGKSFITSRRALGEDPTHRAEPEEYEKSIDTHHKSSIASDSPRGEARWLSRYRSHSTRDRYDGPNSPPEKQEVAPTGDGVPPSTTKASCFSSLVFKKRVVL